MKYGDSFGFIGLYIVKPEYRGKIYGVKMGRLALKYLKDRNMGVDGVLEKQENYKAFGFNLAYRNIRYEGKGGGIPAENSDIVTLSSLPFEAARMYTQDMPDIP